MAGYPTANMNFSDLGRAHHSPPRRRLLLLRDGEALPETLDLKVLASGPVVDVLDVVGGGLEVAGGVVALGEEDVALGPGVGGLVDGNGGTLREKVC